MTKRIFSETYGGRQRRKWILRKDAGREIIGASIGISARGVILVIGGPSKYGDMMMHLARLAFGVEGQAATFGRQRLRLRYDVIDMGIEDAVVLFVQAAIDCGWELESVASFRRLMN